MLPGMPSDEAARVLAAIPDGYQRAGSAARWCQALEQHPALAQLRTDARENALAVLWVLARYTDRRTCLTRPTWARLQAVSGLSASVRCPVAALGTGSTVDRPRRAGLHRAVPHRADH